MNETVHVTQHVIAERVGTPRGCALVNERETSRLAGGVRPSGPGRDCGPDCRLCGSRRMHGRRAVSKETTVVPPKTSLPAPGERTAAEHDRRPPPAVAYVSGESRWARHGGLQATKQKALQRRKEGFPGGGGGRRPSPRFSGMSTTRASFFTVSFLCIKRCARFPPAGSAPASIAPVNTFSRRGEGLLLLRFTKPSYF